MFILTILPISHQNTPQSTFACECRYIRGLGLFVGIRSQ
jgi:hypothetical protein